MEPTTLFAAGSFAVSLLSSLFGASQATSAAAANKKQINDQRKYARNVAKLKLRELMDADKYQKDTLEIAKQNYQAEKDYQEKLWTDDWINRTNIQNKRYDDEVDAFNASVDAFEQQVDLNDVSAGVARRDSQRVLQEQYDAIAYETENLRLDLESGREDRRLQLQNLNTQKGLNRRRANIEKTKLKRQLNAAMDEFNTSSAELVALTDTARAETAEKLRIQRYESLLEEGTFRAKGMAGRSALKAMRSMAAQDAFAQQSIVDALVRNDRMSAISKQKLVDNINNTRKLAKSTMAEINFTIRADAEQRNAERLGIGLKEVQQARKMGLNMEQLNASQRSARDQFNSDITQIGLDEYAANIRAQNNLLAEPEKPDPLPKPLMPPEPIFQEPMATDYDAIKKLNKKAGKAIPQPFAPSSLYTWTKATGDILSATQTLQSRLPPNPNSGALAIGKAASNPLP